MSWKRLSILGVLCLLAAGTGIAQDPTKVAPTHYKLGFENELVQVVYIHYAAHTKSALHEHPAGIVVNLSNGHLRFTDQNGKMQEVRAIHGEARWFPSLKHKVENLSDTDYDGVYIGVKSANAAANTHAKEARVGRKASEEEILAALRLIGEGQERPDQGK